MTLTDTLAYYPTESITAIKSFIVHATMFNYINVFELNLLTLFYKLDPLRAQKEEKSNKMA
jgi:hypothetical protein